MDVANCRMALTKEFTFDAAHKLAHHRGKCKHLHGHTYKLVVTISGTVNQNGFVIDFSEIKDLVKKTVISPLDHSFLNEVLAPLNPTVENIAVWIWQQISSEMEANPQKWRGIRLEELTLYETPDSAATLKREWTY